MKRQQPPPVILGGRPAGREHSGYDRTANRACVHGVGLPTPDALGLAALLSSAALVLAWGRESLALVAVELVIVAILLRPRWQWRGIALALAGAVLGGVLLISAGNAALLFNPVSPEELADNLARLSADPQLRAILVQAGDARVRNFGWERTAEGTYVVFDAVALRAAGLEAKVQERTPADSFG